MDEKSQFLYQFRAFFVNSNSFFFQFQFLVQFLELSQELSSIPIQFRNWPQPWLLHTLLHTLKTFLHTLSAQFQLTMCMTISFTRANKSETITWPYINLLLQIHDIIFFLCI